ncbi:FAD-binding protein, partial [bacterium]|nr:FAD-binding protein [bacterium]
MMKDLQLKALDGGTTTVSGDKLSVLEAQFDGILLTPDDPTYGRHCEIWNGMIQRRPGLIARCTDTQDVQSIVRFSKTHNLLTSVRGGGHNVAGYSLCDGGVAIDMSPMNRVDVDSEKKISHVQGGATLGDMDRASQQHGLATPVGAVSATGIGGLALNGGYGFLSNLYGMTCDNILSAEIVTPEGEILEVNGTEHAELLWAIRGGGGNFGVVTRFDFRLYPVGPEVRVVFCLYDAADGLSIMRKWRDLNQAAPDEIGTLLSLGTVPVSDQFPEEIHGRDFVLVVAMYGGEQTQGAEEMKPWQELGPVLADFSANMPYLEAQQLFDEDYPDGLRYYWKSQYTDTLDDHLMEKLLKRSRVKPSVLSTIDIWCCRGAIARRDPNHGSFAYHEQGWMVNVEANWECEEDDHANMTWSRETLAEVPVTDGLRVYPNFPGLVEGGLEDARNAWGTNYLRLAVVKAEVDADNRFR